MVDKGFSDALSVDELITNLESSFVKKRTSLSITRSENPSRAANIVEANYARLVEALGEDHPLFTHGAQGSLFSRVTYQMSLQHARALRRLVSTLWEEPHPGEVWVRTGIRSRSEGEINFYEQFGLVFYHDSYFTTGVVEGGSIMVVDLEQTESGLVYRRQDLVWPDLAYASGEARVMDASSTIPDDWFFSLEYKGKVEKVSCDPLER